MKSEFQQLIDMLDNADIIYAVRYSEAGAGRIIVGKTEFYFDLSGVLIDVRGYSKGRW